ncbi:hypothetical protein T492DRAFT_444108 [Pavlovales sp. CCMP2436]|nr:hypothetical protein T492DRAFT_444108 [Pavlovales sp. CCMP2436]
MEGVNHFLQGEGHRVGRGACGALNAVNPLADGTKLLHLLSDSADAADGNDVLIVVIAAMVRRYNDVVDAIAGGQSVQPELHPAAVSVRNLVVGDLLPHELSVHEPAGSAGARADFGEGALIEGSVEAYWRPRTLTFELGTLSADISELFVKRCRRIGDPELQLRQPFRFRAVRNVLAGSEAGAGAEEAETLAAAAEAACATAVRAAGGEPASAEQLGREARAQWGVFHAVLYAVSYSQLRALLRGAKIAADLLAEMAGARPRPSAEATSGNLSRAWTVRAILEASCAGSGAEDAPTSPASAQGRGGPLRASAAEPLSVLDLTSVDTVPPRSSYSA